MVNVALIGLGKQGMEYLEGQKHCDQLNIVAGCDSNSEQRAYIAEQYPDIKLVEDVQALSTMNLDGIIMALPHHIYEKVWDSALELQCPILKEKPLGRTLTEARSFERRAKEKQCPLQTAIQRRDHPSYIRLKKELEGKVVSNISLTMNLGFSGQKTVGWRDARKNSGGGALLDSGYHMIDLAHFLVSQFDLLSATLWKDEQLHDPSSNEIEDAMQLVCRQGATWLSIQSRTFIGKDGYYPKGESVIAHTDQGIFSANRSFVWRGLPEGGEVIAQYEKSWKNAMVKQLNDFSQLIRHPLLEYDKYWDQLPAQKIIDQAYHVSSLLYGGERYES